MLEKKIDNLELIYLNTNSFHYKSVGGIIMFASLNRRISVSTATRYGGNASHDAVCHAAAALDLDDMILSTYNLGR